MDLDPSRLDWRKSTKSAIEATCVEVASAIDVVAVRDSKSPTGPMLIFSNTSWRNFVAGIRDGEFDLQ